MVMKAASASIEGQTRPSTAGQSRRPRMKKKRNYNPEAIEKMKERLSARKQKAETAVDGGKSVGERRRRPRAPLRLQDVQLEFAESEEMTQFEGRWVAREACGRLLSMRTELERRGVAADLVERRIQQQVRREHRALKLRLIGALSKETRRARERAEQQTGGARRRKHAPARTCGLTLTADDPAGTPKVKFDGFWVGEAGAERLRTLKSQLTAEGRSEVEVGRQLRLARRREERLLKAGGRLLCVRCGGRGHEADGCAVQVAVAGANACFKCGASDHRLAQCPLKGSTSAALPFAECFRCKRTGHMSRDCPQVAADETAVTPIRQRSRASNDSGTPHWMGLAHEAGSPPAVKSTPPSANKQKHTHFTD